MISNRHLPILSWRQQAIEEHGCHQWLRVGIDSSFVGRVSGV